MTKEGVAVLVRINPDRAGDINYDIFREGESDHDPVRCAEALRKSCESDFPGSLWTIALNERARELMADRRMREWGIE